MGGWWPGGVSVKGLFYFRLSLPPATFEIDLIDSQNEILIF